VKVSAPKCRSVRHALGVAEATEVLLVRLLTLRLVAGASYGIVLGSGIVAIRIADLERPPILLLVFCVFLVGLMVTILARTPRFLEIGTDSILVHGWGQPYSIRAGECEVRRTGAGYGLLSGGGHIVWLTGRNPRFSVAVNDLLLPARQRGAVVAALLRFAVVNEERVRETGAEPRWPVSASYWPGLPAPNPLDRNRGEDLGR